MPANPIARVLAQMRSLHRNARLYLLSNTIQAVTAAALFIVYTLYLSALGYSTNFIGLVVVLGTIGAGLAILPSQPLVHHYGWKTMLIWSNLIGGVAIFLQLVMPTPPVLVVTSLGAGASIGIFLVINAPFLAAYSTPEDRTTLFGLSNALSFLAAVLGSLLGGFLPDFFARPEVLHSGFIQALDPFLVAGARARTYELALLAGGATALPSMIPVLLLTDQHSGSRLEAAIAAETAPLRTPWRERLAGASRRIRREARGVIGRFATSQALLGFGAGLWLPYINLYIVERLGASTFFYGVLTAIQLGLIALASLAAAPISDRFGKIRTAVVVYLASVPFLVLMGAVPVVGVVSVAYLIRSSFTNTAGPPVQAFYMEAVPARDRVYASGVYNVAWQAVGALAGGVGGVLISVAGYQLPFFVAAPCYAASALLLARWFWPSSRDTVGQDHEMANGTM